MKRVLVLSILIVGLLILPRYVEALTFDFSGSAGSVPSFSLPIEGVSAYVTGWADGDIRRVHQDINGLGVIFTGDRAMEGISGQIDGRGQKETLVVEFDRTVALENITFGLFEENDGYRMFVDGADGKKEGKIFSFSVVDADDDYKLKELSVSTVFRIDESKPLTAEVPEPASLISVSFGLFGIVFRKGVCRWVSWSRFGLDP